VPTTLLAQVDAAHGGKTGVDHRAAKNLIGAFWPPALVVCDTDYLATLPPREVAGGLAEVLKHAVIADPDLLDLCGRADPATFVERAARIKLAIAGRDPREAGERRLLNLGHTLGHAIERASDYALHHGEAVALGLRAACRIATAHSGFPAADAARVEAALDRCGLPGRAMVPRGAVEDALRHDKKRRKTGLRWVLPAALGDVRVFEDVPAETLEIVLMGLIGTKAKE
jgi:3-dehydroquinate synthetase